MTIKTFRQLLKFVIISLIAYFTLRILMVLVSPQIYYLNYNLPTIHKDVNCNVIKSSINKDGASLVVFHDNTLKDSDDTLVCYHCVWRPILLYSFGIVVLMYLLYVIKKL